MNTPAIGAICGLIQSPYSTSNAYRTHAVDNTDFGLTRISNSP
jgi:hypothetical protein